MKIMVERIHNFPPVYHDIEAKIWILFQVESAWLNLLLKDKIFCE
jgi:hypothetical protein